MGNGTVKATENLMFVQSLIIRWPEIRRIFKFICAPKFFPVLREKDSPALWAFLRIKSVPVPMI